MTNLAQGRESSVPVRTRYFDEVVEGVLQDTPVRQVVMPAAGMDVRCFRLSVPPDAVFFELDQPHLLDLKTQLLAEAGAERKATCERRSVPVDLTSNWPVRLLAAGMRPELPTLWVIEGLVCYLPEPAVHDFLDVVTGLSAHGSHLVTDILGAAMLDRGRPWLRAWLERLDTAGMGQQFGTDDPECLFEKRGWNVEVSQFSKVAHEYGRWPYRMPSRAETDLLDSFLIHASL